MQNPALRVGLPFASATVIGAYCLTTFQKDKLERHARRSGMTGEVGEAQKGKEIELMELEARRLVEQARAQTASKATKPIPSPFAR